MKMECAGRCEFRAVGACRQNTGYGQLKASLPAGRNPSRIGFPPRDVGRRSTPVKPTPRMRLPRWVTLYIGAGTVADSDTASKDPTGAED